MPRRFAEFRIGKYPRKGQVATLPLQYTLNNVRNYRSGGGFILHCGGGPDVTMMGGGGGGVSAYYIEGGSGGGGLVKQQSAPMMAPKNSLPHDVLFLTFSFLNFRDLRLVSFLCKAFYEAAFPHLHSGRTLRCGSPGTLCFQQVRSLLRH